MDANGEDNSDPTNDNVESTNKRTTETRESTEYLPRKEYIQPHDYKPPVKTHFDHVFKIMLVGDSGVGKTSLVTRFIDGDISENISSMTGGIEFKHVIFDVIDHTCDVKYAVKLQLWDSAGQPRFRMLAKTHFKNKHAFLLFYDVTQRTTFDNVTMWMSEIKDVVDEPLVYLVANKCDCDGDKRLVTYDEGVQLAASLKVSYFEASAISGHGVAVLFKEMAKMLVESNRKT